MGGGVEPQPRWALSLALRACPSPKLRGGTGSLRSWLSRWERWVGVFYLGCGGSPLAAQDAQERLAVLLQLGGADAGDVEHLVLGGRVRPGEGDERLVSEHAVGGELRIARELGAELLEAAEELGLLGGGVGRVVGRPRRAVAA